MPLRRYEHVSGSSREAARDAAAKLYAEGATVRYIATELGRSYGFVYRLLVEANVTLRSRGSRTPTNSTADDVPGQLELINES